MSPSHLRHHEGAAGRMGGIDGGRETKRSFALGTAGGGTSGVTRVARGDSGHGGVPRLSPLTQRPLTQEWAHPAAPGCAGSSSRARGGWHPDTARTEGTVRELHWTQQEQAGVRRQTGESPEHRWDEHGHTGNAVSTLGLANPQRQTTLVTAPGQRVHPSQWLQVGYVAFLVPHRLP